MGGTLSAPPIPVVDQHGDGSGNAPPSPTAGTEMRAMKTGEALQRLQCARVLAEIWATLEVDETSDLAESAITIAREAAASLVPPKPRA